MGKVKAALGGVAAYEVGKRVHERRHKNDESKENEAKHSNCNGKEKLVLTCDGGGVRGLATAQFLYRLEQETGKPLYDLFDMFVGTSVGAVLVSSIACKKASMEEGLDFFSPKTLKGIFHESLKDKIVGLAQPDPKYEGDGKSKYFKDYFGRLVLQDAKKPVLLTCYDLETRMATVMRSTEKDIDGKKIKVADACDGSTAAPAYFPAHKVNKRWVIDGGVVANNPTMVGYADAAEMWPDSEIHLLSIGTGRRIRPIKGKDASGWGGIQWLTHGLIDIAMDDTIIDQQAKRILHDRYLRVNSDLMDADDDMDAIGQDNLDLLIELGNNWWDLMGEKVLSLLRNAGKI